MLLQSVWGAYLGSSGEHILAVCLSLHLRARCRSALPRGRQHLRLLHRHHWPEALRRLCRVSPSPWLLIQDQRSMSHSTLLIRVLSSTLFNIASWGGSCSGTWLAGWGGRSHASFETGVFSEFCEFDVEFPFVSPHQKAFRHNRCSFNSMVLLVMSAGFIVGRSVSELFRHLSNVPSVTESSL